jgi:hypothetical protein
MSPKARKPLIAASVVAVIVWLFWNRETTEWLDTVPDRFIGDWILVQGLYDGGDGVRSIGISANSIVLHEAFDDGEEQRTQSFPVKKVSFTATPDHETGRMIIFFGEPSDDIIAKRRWEFRFGSKQQIFIQEIVPTGWGEDHWFDVGEFVKSD